jgi:hypothetical protein
MTRVDCNETFSTKEIRRSVNKRGRSIDLADELKPRLLVTDSTEAETHHHRINLRKYSIRTTETMRVTLMSFLAALAVADASSSRAAATSPWGIPRGGAKSSYSTKLDSVKEDVLASTIPSVRAFLCC